MVAFQNELCVIAFLAATWLLEKLMVFGKGSALLGNLIAGILLGPALADIVPHPEAWKLIGMLGVLILVIDGSLSVDLKVVQKYGIRAFVAATIGVIGPVALSMLVVMGLFGRPWKVALATGAALAPTSLGFAGKLLTEFGQLQTDMGQLICTVCVIDDVLSLMLLSEVQALNQVSPGIWTYLSPVVASLGSIAVGCFLASFAFPVIIPRLLSILPCSEKHAQLRRWLICSIMIVTCTALAFGAAVAGSSALLGCFCGALSFSAYPEVVEAWSGYSKQFVAWGTRLFFAATVGFGVPKVSPGTGNLLDPISFGKGCVLCIVCVVGKALLGVMAVPLTFGDANRFGWAMQGRGEFSFLIADQAQEDGLFKIVEADFASVVWGLLLTCFLTPFAFRYFLKTPDRTEADAKVVPELEGTKDVDCKQVPDQIEANTAVNV